MEVQTQVQIDRFVKQKLLLYKEIDELSVGLSGKQYDPIKW